MEKEKLFVLNDFFPLLSCIHMTKAIGFWCVAITVRITQTLTQYTLAE